MRRAFHYFVAVIGLGFALSCGNAARAGELSERIQRVENGLRSPVTVKGAPPQLWTLQERMQHYKIPGVSIAVIRNGEIDWARGYGVTEAGSSAGVTPDTLFQAASISKPVAAMAALHMSQYGNFSLDEDVNDKLKSWKVPENSFTKDLKVTVRRILSHSAGLTVHGFSGYEAGVPVPSLVQVLNGEKPANSPAIRVEALPGTIWNYSGGGFTVLQQLMIDVSGMPFPELMRKMVLERLKMMHSTYQQPLPSELAGSAASGHLPRGNPIPGKRNTYPEMAAAGLWTTPSDLARFAIELQQSLRNESNRVLTVATTKEMLTRQIGSSGLGIMVEGEGESARFSHGGANEGFRCFLVAYRSGGGAVIMTNSDRGGELYREVLLSISAEYGWPDYRPQEKTAIPVERRVYAQYLGKYELVPGILVTISEDGGRLFVQMPGVDKAPIYAESPEKFFSAESGASFLFGHNANGQITLTARGRTAKKIQ